MKSADSESNLPIWNWLEELLQHLGTDGMSSEESENEGDLENVLRVKAIPWHRNMENELAIIDQQQLIDDDIFTPRGSKPIKRLQVGNAITHRDPPCEWPRVLHDNDWYESKPSDYCQATLKVSKDEFKWMKIMVGESIR
jgi:hypothetical protein